MPVFRKSCALFEIFFCVANPTMTPISKAPVKFVTKVNIGKVLLQGIQLIAYLNIAPIAPPSPTIKIFKAKTSSTIQR